VLEREVLFHFSEAPHFSKSYAVGTVLEMALRLYCKLQPATVPKSVDVKCVTKSRYTLQVMDTEREVGQLIIFYVINLFVCLR